MSKNVEKKKTKVAIYIKFEEDVSYIDMQKKEKELIDYCNKNGYEIVKKYYDNQPINVTYYTHAARTLITDTYPCDYELLIVKDMNDLGATIGQIFGIYQMITDGDAFIETINQGLLHKDVFNINAYIERKIYYNEQNK